MRLRLWADIPIDKAASGLEVEIPLPAHVARVHCEVDQPGAAALQVCICTNRSRRSEREGQGAEGMSVRVCVCAEKLTH